MKNTRFISILLLSLVFLSEIQAQQLVLVSKHHPIHNASQNVKTQITTTDIFYYSNGAVKEIRKTTNNKLQGSWKIFYTNGQLKKEGNFQNDKTHGEWKIYSKKGALVSIENYNKGNEHGDWKSFHTNGKIKVEGVFVDGKRQGPWRVYDHSGTIEKIITFEDDQEKSELILEGTSIDPSLFSLSSSISNY